jgi:hypothetical protein
MGLVDHADSPAVSRLLFFRQGKHLPQFCLPNLCGGWDGWCHCFPGELAGAWGAGVTVGQGGRDVYRLPFKAGLGSL